MKRTRAILILAAAAASCASLAWGPKGHAIVNSKAADAMTGPAGEYFRAHRDYLARHAIDADDAKKTDKAEGPRHYLDLDVHIGPPYQTPVYKKDEWAKKFGATAFDNGLLPWATADRYAMLVRAFRDKDWNAALKHAAWLGHYVGDAHMPFHAVKDYDGVAAGQKGIHWYLEGELVNEYVSESDVRPGSVIGAGRDKTPVEKRVFDWLAESASLCEKVLAYDRETTRDGKRDLNAFADKAKPLVVVRMMKAAERLAMLWQSAWIEAGKPDLP